MPSRVPISLPPGVFRNGTDYQASGRYWDSELVRWFDGVVRPMQGWAKVSDDQVTGIPRGLLAWKDDDGNNWVAVGTTEKLYIYSGGAFIDVTPIGLAAGLEDAISVDGWGAGSFGSGTFGGPRVLPDTTPASMWQFDTWGQYLVGCMTGDGKLYQWKANPAQLALLIDNAPVDCKGCFVTPERHLVAYGADGNPRLVRWSSQEQLDVWAPQQLNTAGDYELQTDGTIQTAIKTRGETVLFTEIDTHIMRYVGQPFVYGIEKLSDASGIVGPRAGVFVDSGIFWMGQQAFFYYDGTVKSLNCEVADYVFSDINRAQSSKVYCSHISAFSEVWWFYPSNDSNEINRYVVFNYRDGVWYIGQEIQRTCWEDAGVYGNPLAASADGYLYAHEFGWTADGTAILDDRRARSGPVEIRPGNQVMHVTEVIPDERTGGQAKLKFYSKFEPEDSYTEHGPFALSSRTKVRFTGRMVALEIVGNVDADWRFGTPRLMVDPGGRR